MFASRKKRMARPAKKTQGSNGLGIFLTTEEIHRNFSCQAHVGCLTYT